MNKSLFLLFFVFCFIYDPYTFAMQLPSSEGKEMVQLPVVKTIVLPTNPVAIRSSTYGRIAILDCKEYTVWDYNYGETISRKRATIRNRTNICFHPIGDKVFLCGDQNSNNLDDRHAFFIRYDYHGDGTGGKAFYYPDYEIDSGLLSKEGSILFMANKKKLIFYDYEKNIEEHKTLKKYIGVLFTYPFANQPYFLCSGDSQKKIYKITPKDKKYSVKRLYEFSFDADFRNWIYNSQEELFFFINKENRMLHAISIKDQKKPKEKKYRHNDGFSIAAMAIHPSKKFLVLAAQKDNVIEFVDVKNYKNIKHVFTATHEPLHAQHKVKKITFSHDGAYVFIANGRKCLMLDLPVYIKYVDAFEKIVMKPVFEQCGIPADIRKSIWYFLWKLFIKDYGK